MDAHTPSMLDFLNVESLPVLIENIAMKAHKLHGLGNDLSNLVRRGSSFRKLQHCAPIRVLLEQASRNLVFCALQDEAELSAVFSYKPQPSQESIHSTESSAHVTSMSSLAAFESSNKSFRMMSLCWIGCLLLGSSRSDPPNVSADAITRGLSANIRKHYPANFRSYHAL